MTLRHLLLSLGLTALVLGGSACDKKQDQITAAVDAGVPDTGKKSAPTNPIPAKDPHAALKGPRTHFVLSVKPTPRSGDVLADAKKIAGLLSKETGFRININVPTSYKASVKSLRSDEAQIAYFGSWPYMAGHMKADMEVLVVDVIDGKPSYQSNWLALKKSKVKKLNDLKGKKIAFSSPTSAAGFLFPAAQLLKEKVIETTAEGDQVFKAMVFASSEESALKGLLAGKWDAVAVSERAIGKYLTPAEAKLLVVLSAQGPVPNPSIAMKSTLPPETKEKFRTALLKVSAENKELFGKVFGMNELMKREHYQHADAMQQAGDLAELKYPL